MRHEKREFELHDSSSFDAGGHTFLDTLNVLDLRKHIKIIISIQVVYLPLPKYNKDWHELGLQIKSCRKYRSSICAIQLPFDLVASS